MNNAQPSNKEQLMKGAILAAVSLPFFFSGPVLFSIIGYPLMQKGQYWGMVISILFMAAAVLLLALGIRKMLRAFFNPEKN